EINGSNIIILNEPFDKSWRKVGLALDQAGIDVQDKDRVSGIYFVRAGEDIEKKSSLVNTLMFWRSDAEKNLPKNSIEGARYKITVRENNTGSEISALNGNSGKDKATERIIELLYKQLAK
ncbi:MAG: outer membrane protein assembly factor BamC, partial [Candidatus Nitrotoga sp.]